MVAGIFEEARTTAIFRIAELIGRYKAEQDTGGKWRVWDSQEHKALEADYTDEHHARAGCRMAAACDIHALFDERPGR